MRLSEGRQLPGSRAPTIGGSRRGMRGSQQVARNASCTPLALVHSFYRTFLNSAPSCSPFRLPPSPSRLSSNTP